MAKGKVKKSKKRRARLMKLRDRARLLSLFGRRIQKLRIEKGFKPSEFALKSGIDVGNLAKYEQGNREPGLVVIIMLATALEIDPRELLDFEFDYDQDY